MSSCFVRMLGVTLADVIVDRSNSPSVPNTILSFPCSRLALCDIDRLPRLHAEENGFKSDDSGQSILATTHRFNNALTDVGKVAQLMCEGRGGIDRERVILH